MVIGLIRMTNDAKRCTGYFMLVLLLVSYFKMRVYNFN